MGVNRYFWWKKKTKTTKQQTNLLNFPSPCAMQIPIAGLQFAPSHACFSLTSPLAKPLPNILPFIQTSLKLGDQLWDASWELFERHHRFPDIKMNVAQSLRTTTCTVILRDALPLVSWNQMAQSRAPPHLMCLIKRNHMLCKWNGILPPPDVRNQIRVTRGFKVSHLTKRGLPSDYRITGQLLFQAVKFKHGYLQGWLTSSTYAKELWKNKKSW